MKYRDRIRREIINSNRYIKVTRILWVTLIVIVLAVVLLTWLSSEQYRKEKSELEVPDFDGSPYVVINNDVPFFESEDYTKEAYENYGELDFLGRCTAAMACLGRELMPTDERGDIGSIRPTGWMQAKYEGIIDSKPPYLYNRCHLIAYCLTGENANEKNLITGTRYFNVEGMLPFEEQVADYLYRSKNHVLYRVTPIYEGNNLVASGVLMEAQSVEDNGKGLEFCVYCYNVQPGVIINYRTGDSRPDLGWNRY